MPPLHFGKQTRIKFVFGEIHIKVSGIQEIVLFIDRLIKKSSDLRVPFQQFQSVWFDSIAANFAAGGDPVDWPALSPAYEARKSVTYPGQPMMRATDQLYESLTSQTSDTIWYAGPKSIQFSTRVPYFEFHQQGTSRMPARPVLTLSDDAARELVRLIEEHVMPKADL